MTDTVRLNAFGPIEAVVNGVAVPLGPRKQRTLLAVLLCRRGVEVPTGEIIDALWAGRPPASAASNLRSYVHGLRDVLGAGAIAGSGRPGYRLEPDRPATDLADFHVLCAAGDAALDRGDTPAARAAFRGAVALRRDRPFAGIGDVPLVDAEGDRLEERWLRAVEQRVEADLDAGRAAELVAELHRLTGRHPYRERFAVLLMLALYRSGRQAEALAVFRRTAALLRDELGVEPGTELSDLHAAVLRQDSRLDRVAAPAPRTRVPAELPAVPDTFTGRAAEAARLTEFVDACRDRRTLPLIAIVGLAGAGKTTLATYWAHRAAPGHPDGQLFVDLRGFSAEPEVGVSDALARMLRSLGVETDRVPDDPEERGALLRSLLADKRMLIVLDNAGSAAQVLPLLPGGHGNTVLVTSRNRLPSLTLRCGARQLELRSLDGREARELLRRMVGAERVDADPEATEELGARCGWLPLALCIAAADLADDPHRTVASYLARRSGESWVDALGVTDDPGLTVRAAFDLSYRTLTPGQQRLLGLLGLVPGPDFTVAAAAALTGGDAAGAAADLARLAGAHLVQRLPHERFSFHDLIRAYARNRAGDDRDAALRGLYAYYVDRTVAADRALYPGSLRLPGGRVGTMAEAEAADWFEHETPALVAACLQPAGPSAVRLADVLAGHLWAHRELSTWSAVVHAAGRSAGDRREQTALAVARATVASCRRDFPEAARRYEAAARLARQAGWQFAETTALGGWAEVLSEMGHAARGMAVVQEVLDMARRNGWRLEAAKALMHIAIEYTEWGRLTDALDALAEALALADAEGSLVGRAKILLNGADVFVLRRDFDEAARRAEEGLRIAEENGYATSAALGCQQRAAIERGRGDAGAALRWALRGLARAAGDSRAVGVAQHEVALAYDAVGGSGQAIDYHRAAHRLASAIDSRYLAVEYAIALGLAEHRLGNTGAGPDLAAQLDRARRRGYRGLEGAALAALAEQRGDPALARRALSVQAEAGWWTEPAHLRRLAGDVPDMCG